MSLIVRLFAGGLAVASGLVCAGSAHAVILSSDETRNGTPSADSIAYSAWQLQGQFGGFLGTPIAPNYFITAAHIGASSGQIVFQGASYSIDPTFGTGGRSVVPGSDMAIWKVTSAFQTYAPLYTDSNEFGQHLVVIGRGTQRGSEVLVGEQLKGWQWGKSDGMQSWGENDVSGIVKAGANLGDMLQFDFDRGDLPNECALSAGDSGGGVFIQDAGVWKLAGINYSVTGPFSRSRSGAEPFMGAIFDLRGLFVQTDQDTWMPGYGAGSAYASRVSSHASSIYSLVPGCPVIRQNYTVTGFADMGTVDVAETTTVGAAGNPATLKATSIRGNTLTIAAGSHVVINPNGTARGTSRLATLSIADGGQLDLTDNSLIIQASQSTRESALAQISALIASGRNSGSGLWQGSGITSSSAAANALTGLAIILNDNGSGAPIYQTFRGQDVDANSILVGFTWNGDVNLDGKVDAADYFLVDSGFITHRGTYRNGDLNYDGLVNASDYFLMDSAFIGQAGASQSLLSHLGIAPIPEPAALGLLTLAGLAVASRRVRH